jgi:hypothetical protein
MARSRGSEVVAKGAAKAATIAALSTAIALSALLWGAGSSSATHLGLRPCSSLHTRSLSVTHVNSNFGCASTHRAIRRLLRHGLRRLPGLTTQMLRWGCGQAGANHICTRYIKLGTNPQRIVFQARRRR